MCHLPIFPRPALAELCLGAPPFPEFCEGVAGLKLNLAHISSDMSTFVEQSWSIVDVYVKTYAYD